MIEFKKIKYGLPPVGTPLIVRTFNKIEDKHEIKYPVYYVKEHTKTNTLGTSFLRVRAYANCCLNIQKLWNGLH